MERPAMRLRAKPTAAGARSDGAPRRRVPARSSMLLALAACVVASCERTPTKSDYIDARVQVECAGRSGEAFRLCRLEVIKKYMRVPLEALQAQFPPPEVEGRMGCR